jgi:hypothetical protein
VINGTPVPGKGNPSWPISNVTETRIVPPAGATASFVTWLADLPRRFGNRLFAMNDAEAGWRGWEVTVLSRGLGRQYRDPRFVILRNECDAHGGRVEYDAALGT